MAQSLIILLNVYLLIDPGGFQLNHCMVVVDDKPLLQDIQNMYGFYVICHKA